MDTFMDQLSQKLNAQQIIRANGEAESEAMGVMRAQVREYQDCLDRMKNVADVKNGAAPIYVMNSNTDGTPITQTWDYSHSYGQCWRLQVGVKYFFN